MVLVPLVCRVSAYSTATVWSSRAECGALLSLTLTRSFVSVLDKKDQYPIDISNNMLILCAPAIVCLLHFLQTWAGC
jgi:hypothetical protein